MKKITALTIILAILVLILSSCAKNNDPLFYEKGKINAEIIIRMNGTELRAELCLSEPCEECERDATVRFIAPQRVSGLTVTRKNGTVEATLGGTVMNELDCTPLLYVTELFSTGGSVSFTKVTELDGERVTELTVTNGEAVYTVFVTSDGLPRRIVSDFMTANVVWIEVK